MGRLYLYAVFHANLNFSYIPKDLYPQILRRCYWPLLQIIEEQQIPLGLEFSAYTLQVIAALDPSFIEQLRRLWHGGTCEVIGSGYVQAIMPLIPARVNQENLRRGNVVYKELLGQRPTVAFVHEQVCSAGLPRLYREAGYHALIMDWNSTADGHLDHQLRYQPCNVAAGDGGQIAVIWNSVVAYRDFQKYVEQEISLNTYLERLFRHLPTKGERAFPLYGSDWEVFDFKPWRSHPEGFPQEDLGEMRRISHLLDLLQCKAEIEFIAPSSLLARFPQRPMVHLGTSTHPVPYKKQDLFGVTRWAVGGRENIRLNTQCYQLFQRLLQIEWLVQRNTDNASPSVLVEIDSLWEAACFLWSSDYRTFTTDEKYLDARNRMGDALARAERLWMSLQRDKLAPGQVWLGNCSPFPSATEPISFPVSSNDADADSAGYELEVNGTVLPCQVAERVMVGTSVGNHILVAMPSLAAGQAAISVLRRRAAPSPILERPDRTPYQIDTAQHWIETPTVRLRLLPKRGGTIEELTFPSVNSQPLIRRIHNGVPGSLRLADELFCGDLVLHDRLGRKVTDLQPAKFHYPESDERHELFVPIRCWIQTELGMIWKTYRIYLHEPRLDLIVRMQLRDTVPASFRVGRLVLDPAAFDHDTLYYATVNGGLDIERYALRGQRVLQDEPLGVEVSAGGCLGATEGWVVIGDATKALGFITHPGRLYSVPMIHYEERDTERRAFLLSLVHSLGELDETSHALWRGHSTWRISVVAGRGDLTTQVRTSALLANGGIFVVEAKSDGQQPGISTGLEKPS